MDWSYEGWALKFGQGLGQKCPVTHALGRSALSVRIRKPRGTIKICHYFEFPFNGLRGALVTRQSNLRKRYGCIIPRVLIFSHDLGGVFRAPDRSHRRQKGGIGLSAARSMQSL